MRTLQHKLIKWCTLTVLFLATSLQLAQPVNAHATEPSVVDLTITDTQVELSITTLLEPWILGLNLDQVTELGGDFSLASIMYNNLRTDTIAAVQARFREEWPRIASKMTLTANGQPIEMALTNIETTDDPDPFLPRWSVIQVAAPLPQVDAKIIFGADANLGQIVVRQLGKSEGAFAGILPIGETTPELTGENYGKSLFWQSLTRFVISGFEHIIPKGVDHILFVLGLFFYALKWRPLLWQVSAFTLAHTITLALASLQLVNLPGSIVEPLIAASIVYVGVENIFGRSEFSRWRVALVFAFGLLHGLGFASVLADVGFDTGQFIVGLIGFNIGVEIGQLAVILVAYLLVGHWFGQRKWYRAWVANPASIAIAMVGLYWTIERVFF